MEKGEITMPKAILGNEQWIKHGIKGKEPCLFSYAEIYYTMQTMYPKMDQLEIHYHARQLRNSDWLKMDNHWDTLKMVIQEQIRENHCKKRKTKKRNNKRGERIA